MKKKILPCEENGKWKNFDKFHNAGYRGLYNGETADDIAKRKGLRYREDILDNMGSEELAANLFRITQTESKLKRDNIKGENNANITHYNIGKNVREAIKKNGGDMPCFSLSISSSVIRSLTIFKALFCNFALSFADS